MFRRALEQGLLDVLGNEGIGCIAFSPLAQGLLTDRYLSGVPGDSRVAKSGVFLKRSDITEETLARARALNKVATKRGQSLAQIALAWVLRDSRMTSVIIGASKVEQVDQNLAALRNLRFSEAELQHIEGILGCRAVVS